MNVKIDKDALFDFLKQELDLQSVKEALGGLKKIDFNPFDDDGDQYVGVKAELQHNAELISNAVHSVVGLLERVVVGGLSLNGAQKREMAIKLLDDAIKLPFFLEPFDSIAIGMLIDLGVVELNKVDWGLNDSLPVVTAPKEVYKEVG